MYLHSIFPARPHAFGIGIAVLNSGAHFGGFLSLLLSVRIADAAGGPVGYRAGVWVGAAVGCLAVVANLAVRAFERNFEYDAVQRRKQCRAEAAVAVVGQRSVDDRVLHPASGPFTGVEPGTPRDGPLSPSDKQASAL